MNARCQSLQLLLLLGLSDFFPWVPEWRCTLCLQFDFGVELQVHGPYRFALVLDQFLEVRLVIHVL